MEQSLSCNEGCGWIAAFVAALAYGSFGVPIKYTQHVPVHPFILQTYKTGVMFVFAWLLPVRRAFTPWGLLSGLLWVLGGTAGIFAIQKAGMAVAVGTWASVMVLVNFVWGILIFHEPVANVKSTACAFGLLMFGLLGMSRYSAPPPQPPSMIELEQTTPIDENNSNEKDPLIINRFYGSTVQETETTTQLQSQNDKSLLRRDNKDTVILLGRIVASKRTAGIVGAVLNGLMAGSSLIPLHYAKKHGFGGAHYMLSFATGALISNIVLWILLFAFTWFQQHSSQSSLMWLQTFQSMPACHFSQLALPGIAAGILLSIAMLGSFLSVTALGQGIGNSVIQAKILVSGLWGIFWFCEIQGTIAKWFASASLAVASIVWLSYQRLAAQPH